MDMVSNTSTHVLPVSGQDLGSAVSNAEAQVPPNPLCVFQKSSDQGVKRNCKDGKSF